ncbi:MAG: hypothetical protein U5L08_07650 [Xanthomonadales bacterium]|nr:hypothetical protein [Xanthomonadales bacterium]
MRTLSSFEDRDDAGVLIIHHPRLEQIADRLMADAAASPKSGDVEPILSKVDALSETDLIFQFGVRVIPDSEGIPVILSFGQSSPAVTNSDSDRSIRMAVTSSRTVAEARADAAIAEFVNSTVFAANKPVVVGGEEIGIEMDGRQSTRYESAEFFEDANSMISQTARAEIAGVTTIRRWQANHPDTGHLYVGVVRMWTPSQNYEYGGRLPDAPPSEDASADEDGSAEDEEVSDKIRQSKDLMDGDW